MRQALSAATLASIHCQGYHMLDLRRTASWVGLVLAVFGLGIMAGFFATYTGNVNLATLELDGATHALVQSAFNRNVRHALFFAFFLGPAVFCLLALASARRERPGWWWLVGFIGLSCVLGDIVFTREVDLPLSRLTESWTAATLPADWAMTRDAWNLANAWRAGWSALLFALGLAALIWRAASVHGVPPGSGTRRPAMGVSR
jgi:uncharacterized membrane protein